MRNGGGSRGQEGRPSPRQRRKNCLGYSSLHKERFTRKWESTFYITRRGKKEDKLPEKGKLKYNDKTPSYLKQQQIFGSHNDSDRVAN